MNTTRANGNCTASRNGTSVKCVKVVAIFFCAPKASTATARFAQQGQKMRSMSIKIVENISYILPLLSALSLPLISHVSLSGTSRARISTYLIQLSTTAVLLQASGSSYYR